MNCDRVFDVLTRGPFPSGGADDAPVELHLAGCHECRQLAEALRPAVGLFHEAMAADEDADLPAYRGELSAAGASRLPTALMTAIQRETQPPMESLNQRAPRRTARARLWQMAAALLVGIGLGVGAWSTGLLNFAGLHETPGEATVIPSSIVYQPNEAGRRVLVSLNIPAACLPADQSSTSTTDGHVARDVRAGMNTGAYACCTFCHKAVDTVRPRVSDVAVLARSCIACHSL